MNKEIGSAKIRDHANAIVRDARHAKSQPQCKHLPMGLYSRYLNIRSTGKGVMLQSTHSEPAHSDFMAYYNEPTPHLDMLASGWGAFAYTSPFLQKARPRWRLVPGSCVSSPPCVTSGTRFPSLIHPSPTRPRVLSPPFFSRSTSHVSQTLFLNSPRSI